MLTWGFKRIAYEYCVKRALVLPMALNMLEAEWNVPLKLLENAFEPLSAVLLWSSVNYVRTREKWVDWKW